MKKVKVVMKWDFWDKYILKVLEWLPLTDKKEGLSSGHVQ